MSAYRVSQATSCTYLCMHKQKIYQQLWSCSMHATSHLRHCLYVSACMCMYDKNWVYACMCEWPTRFYMNKQAHRTQSLMPWTQVHIRAWFEKKLTASLPIEHANECENSTKTQTVDSANFIANALLILRQETRVSFFSAPGRLRWESWFCTAFAGWIFGYFLDVVCVRVCAFVCFILLCIFRFSHVFGRNFLDAVMVRNLWMLALLFVCQTDPCLASSNGLVSMSERACGNFMVLS